MTLVMFGHCFLAVLLISVQRYFPFSTNLPNKKCVMDCHKKNLYSRDEILISLNRAKWFKRQNGSPPSTS